MFGWLKRRPAPPDSGELTMYMKAVETHQDHPVVSRWFHQITPCELVVPGGRRASFLMIEFRDGRSGAMVWNDGDGHWGTGGWRPLSADDLLVIDLSYMQGAAAAGTFGEVLDTVAALRSGSSSP